MGNNDIVLSFIIPVYNVENYIAECLNSILYQFSYSCELILVDDGSTDRSGQICDEYAKNNSSVVVFHQKNMGLAMARNTGLFAARGKYITFVDSDDRIVESCAPRILSWVKEETTDVCFLILRKWYPDGTTRTMGECLRREALKGKSKEHVLKFLASRPKYPGSANAKLFRRDFLLKNKLQFPKDRRVAEDLGFMRDCMLSANSFDFLEEPFYEYRQQREGSITYRFSTQSVQGVILFISESLEILCKDKQPTSKINKYAMGFVAYEYFVLLAILGNVLTKEKDTLAFIKRNLWITNYSQSQKTKVLAMLIHVFRLNITMKLLSRYLVCKKV